MCFSKYCKYQKYTNTYQQVPSTKTNWIKYLPTGNISGNSTKPSKSKAASSTACPTTSKTEAVVA